MKRNILLLTCIMFSEFSFSQFASSFYLNHGIQKECQFTPDAIYFVNGTGLLDKTDYEGNTIWSKMIPYPVKDLTVRGNEIYFFAGQTMARLDTAGNFIWARELSIQLCGTYNYLDDLVLSKDRIFISTSQALHTIPSGMLTFDTAGTLLNNWCDYWGSGRYMSRGYTSLTEGGWFHFGYASSGYLDSWIVHVDSMGDINNSANGIFLNMGMKNFILDVIPMVDSTYMAIENIECGNCASFTPTEYKIGISRFREDGVEVWQKNFFSSSDIISTSQAGSDSSGNIYLFGKTDNDTVSTYFAVKIDSAGNIISSNKWIGMPSSFSLPAYSRMGYHNGYLYCPFNFNTGKSGVFVTDSLLTPPCGLSIAPFSLLQNSVPISYSMWTSYSPQWYSQNNFTLNPSVHSHSAPVDLCLVLNAKEVDFENEILLSPNPVHGLLTLNSSYSKGNFDVEVYNIYGRLCFELKIPNFPLQIDVRNFVPGIYFVRMQNEKGSDVRKLIIE